MLQLKDLAQILAVSHEWAAALSSMAPIHAVIQPDQCGWVREKQAFREFPPIANLVHSPLLRHVATLEIKRACPSLDNACIGLLAQHAPNLQSLWCSLTLTPSSGAFTIGQLRRRLR